MCQPSSPSLIVAQSVRVADDNEPAPRSSESYIEAARVGEESDVSVGVRAHAGEDDDLFFAALVTVYSTYFDGFVALGNGVADGSDLTRVGSDYADV